MNVFIVTKKHLLGLFSSALLLIISVLLYLFAPLTYSYNYCVLLLIVYIFSSLVTIKITLHEKNLFNFHVLFLISFFFVNFVYPVFIYPKSPFYFPVYKMNFNADLITKSTALALVGSCSFGFGSAFFTKNKASFEISCSSSKFVILQIFTNFLLYISFIIIVIYGGGELIKGYSRSTLKIPPGILLLFQIILGLAIIFSFYRKYYKGNIIDFMNKFSKPVIPVIVIFLLIFLISGDRGPAIQITILSIAAYTLFVKPLRFGKFLLLVLAGMIFLTFISYARSKSNEKDIKGITISRGLENIRIDAFYDIGMDLIVNNRNLYKGYEYVNQNGVSYGKNLSYQLFAPFPMVPTLFTRLIFDSEPDDLSSAKILTKESNAHYGLGTNIIIDLFMAFGFAGVCILMFFLGLIVTKIQGEAYKRTSLNYLIAYLFLIGLSVYMPRSTMMDPLRPIVWALFIYNFLSLLRKYLIQLTNYAEK